MTRWQDNFLDLGEKCYEWMAQYRSQWQAGFGVSGVVFSGSTLTCS